MGTPLDECVYYHHSSSWTSIQSDTTLVVSFWVSTGPFLIHKSIKNLPFDQRDNNAHSVKIEKNPFTHSCRCHTEFLYIWVLVGRNAYEITNAQTVAMNAISDFPHSWERSHSKIQSSYSSLNSQPSFAMILVFRGRSCKTGEGWIFRVTTDI